LINALATKDRVVERV